LVAHRGERQVARDIIRRLREADPTKSIEQHMREMFDLPIGRERFDGTAAILRELWNATEGEPKSA
jgi:hypothetical protein